jgi:RNA polymerase sigma-70 factor (ECF subfamily)
MTTTDYQAAVLEHKDRVYSYARYLLRHSEDAQDVAQECLLRLWHHRERVESGAACRNWLLRSAHNLCIDTIRRRRSRAEVDQDENAPEPADVRPDAFRIASASQGSGVLERALLELSQRDRAIVLLREVEGMPYDEIAVLLDLNIGTLKATLHRAREKLRAALTRAEVTP